MPLKPRTCQLGKRPRVQELFVFYLNFLWGLRSTFCVQPHVSLPSCQDYVIQARLSFFFVTALLSIYYVGGHQGDVRKAPLSSPHIYTKSPQSLSPKDLLSLSLQLSSRDAHFPREEPTEGDVVSILKEKEMHRRGPLRWSEAGCPRNLQTQSLVQVNLLCGLTGYVFIFSENLRDRV